MNTKLIGLLVLVICFAAWTLLSNPYQKYSTEEYWTNATLQHVADVPTEAITEQNNNGSVIMFAAAATNDPTIIVALVGRGADVNEGDQLKYLKKDHFRRTYSVKIDENIKGTPLSAAASSSTSPAVVAKLISLGARLDTRLSKGWTPLMVAAYWNTDERIAHEMVKAGADLTLTNDDNETALDIAKRQNNRGVVNVLEQQVVELSSE